MAIKSQTKAIYGKKTLLILYINHQLLNQHTY